MNERTVVAFVGVAVVAYVGLGVLTGLGYGPLAPPEETLVVENKGDEMLVVLVWELGPSTTFQVEYVNGSTETVEPAAIDSLEAVSNVSASGYAARDDFLVYPNSTSSLDASDTGSAFVFFVRRGNVPASRVFLGEGVLECETGTPAANVSVRNDTTTVGSVTCE